MPYEDALRESLGCLYEEASGFSISIDIILKLAKSLKLDTFLDTEDTPGVKRLSIAGSLLLLEIDFKDDNTVVNVSLSSGNHTSDLLPESEFDRKVALNILSDPAKINNATSVVLSLSPETRPSFLRTSKSESYPTEGESEPNHKVQSIAEKIILSSLSGTKLGSFPRNLKYLADLDRVSPPEADLIIYMDSLATYLAAIHQVEQNISPENWEITKGYTSAFGKIVLNDETTNRIGVFLQFWQDSRYLNHHVGKSDMNMENSGDEPKYGTRHTALLAIEEAKAPAADYIAEAKTSPWVLQKSTGENQAIIFTASSESSHLHNQQSVCTNAKWRLVLRFDEPVFLPQSVLEYLCIEDYEEEKESYLDKFWNDATKYRELNFKHEKGDLKFDFSEVSTYKRLRAIALPNLHLLSPLMAALRNQIVFSRILESVALAQNSEYCVKSDSAISQEAKTKIRETLQLSSDVPDEELIGLNTLSNDYIGVQMSDRELDIGSFTRDGSGNENGDENMDSTEGDEFGDETTGTHEGSAPYLVISLEEISFGSPALNYVCRVVGKVSEDNEGLIDAAFTIKNGQIRAFDAAEDDAMDTETDYSRRFTQGLATSEDVLLALEVLG